MQPAVTIPVNFLTTRKGALQCVRLDTASSTCNILAPQGEPRTTQQRPQYSAVALSVLFDATLAQGSTSFVALLAIHTFLDRLTISHGGSDSRSGSFWSP